MMGKAKCGADCSRGKPTARCGQTAGEVETVTVSVESVEDVCQECETACEGTLEGMQGTPTRCEAA